MNIIPDDAIKLIKMLNDNGYEAYLVGGCVRDMLMGTVPHDWDMCTNATPEEIKETMKLNNVYTFDSGIKHGTITAVLNKENYEITTYRSEAGYSDGRHPDKVDFVKDIHEDLKRRDLTINALAYNPVSDKLIDDYFGKCDLNMRVIKCVGNARDRFIEDSLRILRALRFAIKYQWRIDDDTAKAMHELKDELNKISKERITQELEKMLTCGKPVKHYFMEFSDIISVIIPEIKTCINFDQNNKYHSHNVYEHMLYVTDYCDTTDFTIKLAALLHDIGKPNTYVTDAEGHGHFYGHPKVSRDITEEVLRKDLRCSTEQMESILKLVEFHDMDMAPTKASTKKALNKLGEVEMRKWFILKKADYDDHIAIGKMVTFSDNLEVIKVLFDDILQSQECFKITDLAINGNYLIKELGLRPSKKIGYILNKLLDKVINDESIENNIETLDVIARELSEEYDSLNNIK